VSAERPGAGGPPRLAAIDVGSNTTRLLAVQAGSGGPSELVRRLTFTRLGAGVDASGHLAPDAIGRTVAAIAAYTAECRGIGVGRIRIAGTSAVREASNAAALVAEVRRATGETLEAIPGEEEAALSFAGATGDLPPGSYLVCDIGGGSTELAAGRRVAEAPASLAGSISLPLGVVRMTERHITSDPPGPTELAALEADVDRTLDAAGGALPDAAGARLVGVAGTVTSLAAIHLGLRAYDPKAVHGLHLGAEVVRQLYARLAGMTLPEREALPPLPPGRADVIVAGCAILARIMARWGFPDVAVSEKDILDGLVLGMIGGQ
jgi:exopolyphosphatase/guanosine-5'-triphosphate,3'-diphosphate pyrophosphatase